MVPWNLNLLVTLDSFRHERDHLYIHPAFEVMDTGKIGNNMELF
jgi:hypothetical protein